MINVYYNSSVVYFKKGDKWLSFSFLRDDWMSFVGGICEDTRERNAMLIYLKLYYDYIFGSLEEFNLWKSFWSSDMIVSIDISDRDVLVVREAVGVGAEGECLCVDNEWERLVWVQLLSKVVNRLHSDLFRKLSLEVYEEVVGGVEEYGVDFNFEQYRGYSPSMYRVISNYCILWSFLKN